MRLYSFVAAAALASASLAAHADTMLTETFTANGSTAFLGGEIQTSSFQEFDPVLGVLNSITLSFSGRATALPEIPAYFNGLRTADDQIALTNGAGGLAVPGGNNFSFSLTNVTDSNSAALSRFYGSGMTDLLADFVGGVTTSGTTGTITYNYTAATPVAATPEPTSLALLGTGLLGAVGVARKRFAQ